MKKRIDFLDFAKAIAIIFVLYDHSSQFLYPSKTSLYASYVSVSLFILISGICAWTAYGNENNAKKQLQRLGKLFANYAVATAVMYIFMYKSFNFWQYIDYVCNFNIIDAFYFFAVIIQLSLITPWLISWCKFCSKKKYSHLWHELSLIFALVLSVIFYKFTFMFNIVGSGRYLMGASCFAVYYFGILLAKSNVLSLLKGKINLIFVPIYVLSLWIFVGDFLPIDESLTAFFGQGINPAGIEMMFLTIATFLLIHAVFSFLENFSWAKKLIKILTIIGKNTLYIYMYHILIRDIFQNLICQFTNNTAILTLTIYLPMLIIPVVLAEFIKKRKQN